MAQERPLTPEKQLLNLIENPQANTASGVGAQSIKHQGLSFLSPSAWIGRLVFYKDKLVEMAQGKKAIQIDIQFCNHCLIGVSIALAFYLFTNMYIAHRHSNQIEKRLSAGFIRSGQQASEAASLLQHTLDYYVEKIQGRDIFTRQSIRKGPLDMPPEVVQGAALELSETLKLVGISWSNNPDVIIEDTKGGRTYFLRQGQQINKAKVKEILPDRVILVFEGQEFELR